jgi:hypothetical protein
MQDPVFNLQHHKKGDFSFFRRPVPANNCVVKLLAKEYTCAYMYTHSHFVYLLLFLAVLGLNNFPVSLCQAKVMAPVL